MTDNPVWGGVEVRVVDVRRALADQTESVQRYVFGVSEGTLDALRAQFPKDHPEQRFERALNEDQSALSKHVPTDSRRLTSSSSQAPAARFRARPLMPMTPRRQAFAFGRRSRGFKMGDWDGRFRR